MEEAIQNLTQLLKIEELSQEWVEEVDAHDYKKIPDLPQEYAYLIATENISKIMVELSWTIKHFLNSDERAEWHQLSLREDIRKYLALMAFYIEKPNKIEVENAYKDAFAAARLYYVLFLIPGAAAYGIYNRRLFVNSLICLQFIKLVEKKITEKTAILNFFKKVKDYLKDLSEFVILLKEHLAPNIQDILRILIESYGAVHVTLNLDIINDVENVILRDNLNEILGKVQSIINSLVYNPQGRYEYTEVKYLFGALLSRLITLETSETDLHECYKQYVRLLIGTYRGAASKALYVLVQHLCHHSKMEKSNVRLKLIKNYIKFFSQRKLEKFIRWIITLSGTSQQIHRHIAINVLAELMKRRTIEEPIEGIQNPELNLPREQERDIAPQAERNPINDEESEDSSDEDDEPLANLQAQPVEIDASNQRVPHCDILRAIVQRLNDPSNNIRSRALNLIGEYLLSTNEFISRAVQRLEAQEPDIFSNVASHALDDSRAQVRRSAVSLLHNIMKEAPSRSRNSYWDALIKYCRDTCVTVRSVAISALCDLCSNGSDIAVNAYLDGSLRQITDSDTRIQETIANSIMKLILNPIVKSPRNNFPWKLLDEIMKNNYKNYLHVAMKIVIETFDCTILLRKLRRYLNSFSDVINPVLILFLLNCIARLVSCNDPMFLIEYYYEIVEKTEAIDAQALILTLETLRYWSHAINPETKLILKNNIIHGVATGIWDSEGCRIPCCTFALQIEPTQKQWIIDLFNDAQAKAMTSHKVDDWLRAADFAVVCPNLPSVKVLNHLVRIIKANPAAVDGCLVVSLGRLCLRSHKACSIAAPYLSQVMVADGPLSARTNAMLALADIAAKYSMIVDSQLDPMCDCLAPSNPVALRQCASKSLTQLLFGEYLRLRTKFFVSYCSILLDPDEKVREPVEYYVSTCLDPRTIYRNFVDTVISYNNCNFENERGTIQVPVQLPFESRHTIYEMLLQKLSAGDTLKVLVYLGKGVFKAAADYCDTKVNIIESQLPSTMAATLLDTITLFCGPRLKNARKSQADIPYKTKKSVVEEAIPAAIRLYDHLRIGGSQIAAYLEKITTDLLRDFKEEVLQNTAINQPLADVIKGFEDTTEDTHLPAPRKITVEGNKFDPTILYIRRPWQTSQSELSNTTRQPSQISDRSESVQPSSPQPGTSRSTRTPQRSPRRVTSPQPSTSRGRHTPQRTTLSQPRTYRGRRTPQRTTSPQPSTSRGHRTPQRATSPQPSTSQGHHTAQHTTPSQPSTSRGRRISQRTTSPQPSTSQGHRTPQRTTSPQPSTSRGHRTPQRATSPQPSTSRGHATPQRTTSSQPSTSRGHRTPQRTTSPQPSTSQGRHTPQRTTSSQPSTSQGHRTPQRTTSSQASTSQGHRTPQRTSSQPSTSRGHRTPQRTTSLQPSTSQGRHTPQRTTSSQPSTSRGHQTPQRTTSPQPSTSQGRQTPQRRTSSQPSTSQGHRTPQRTTSSQPSSAQGHRTPQRTSSQPSTSRGHRTPQRTNSPQPSTSQGRHTPQRTTSSQPSTSQGHRTPQRTTSPQPSTSRGHQTPQRTTFAKPSTSRSDRTPQRATFQKPSTPRGHHTPQRATTPKPSISWDYHTAQRPASPKPSTSWDYPTPQRVISPIPSTSRDYPTPQRVISPIPSTSRDYPTPQRAFSPKPSTSRDFYIPQRATSPIPSTSRGKHTPQRTTSPIPSTSRDDPTSQLATSPKLCTSRDKHTPQRATSPKPSTSRDFYTPQRTTSPILSTSRGKHTPQRATSPKPSTSRDFYTPQRTTSTISSMSRGKHTPQRPTSPIPSMSRGKHTPQRATSPMPSTSRGKHTPQRATSPIPSMSRGKHTPQRATSPIPSTSRGKHTPQRATSPKLSTSRGKHTSQRATSPKPSTSRDHHTPQQATSPKLSSSRGKHTPQRTISPKRYSPTPGTSWEYSTLPRETSSTQITLQPITSTPRPTTPGTSRQLVFYEPKKITHKRNSNESTESGEKKRKKCDKDKDVTND